MRHSIPILYSMMQLFCNRALVTDSPHEAVTCDRTPRGSHGIDRTPRGSHSITESPQEQLCWADMRKLDHRRHSNSCLKYSTWSDKRNRLVGDERLVVAPTRRILVYGKETVFAVLQCFLLNVGSSARCCMITSQPVGRHHRR